MFTTAKNPNKVYSVTLINEEDGWKKTVQVRGNEYIAEIAEQQGIKLNTSCNAGACITCTGKLLEGEVDQDHSFLKPKELDAGFVLLCKSSPRSDCVIITHQEDALLDL